jgi:secernin
MCDTMVALAGATQDGSVLFAKNSDRDPNEAHQILYLPAEVHAEGSLVKCTYMDIPQVSQTNAVLLAKPFWIWGAEMGANEHGVVIGNEAVFSKIPASKEPGLIGMDYLRLGLERAKTAEAAVHVITDLLMVFGQSGNCGFVHPFYYHNSYLIADPNSAWVLETVDRHWVAQKVKNVRSISNTLSIRKEWDLASGDVVNFALDKGWCKNRDDFDFSRCYSDFLYTTFSDGRRRHQCTSDRLKDLSGEITPQHMMQILRTHRNIEALGRTIIGQDICAHAGFGPVRISQTTGSMVSHLEGDFNTHWVTGTSTPCTAIFKPLWMDAGTSDLGRDPSGNFEDNTFWWQHEILQREVMKSYPDRLELYIAERNKMEEDFFLRVKKYRHSDAELRLRISERCFLEAKVATNKWIDSVEKKPILHKPAMYHRQAWKKWNEKAKLPGTIVGR